MNASLRYAAALVLFSLLPSAQLAPAQGKPSTASPISSNFPAESPNDDASVLVDSSWVALSQELPSKIRTKWGLVSSLTYGVVPGAIIAEYPGQHAELQIETRRPVFSICNVPSFAGAPALVRLHPKKDSRELDAGRLPALGAKIGEAKQSDQVPTEAVRSTAGKCLLALASTRRPPGRRVCSDASNPEFRHFPVHDCQSAARKPVTSPKETVTPIALLSVGDTRAMPCSCAFTPFRLSFGSHTCASLPGADSSHGSSNHASPRDRLSSAEIPARASVSADFRAALGPMFLH